MYNGTYNVNKILRFYVSPFRFVRRRRTRGRIYLLWQQVTAVNWRQNQPPWSEKMISIKWAIR